MADPLARNDWIGTREDRWTDVLPPSWQSAINTNPVVNALARYMQPRQTFDQAAREWQDNIPGNSPIDRIAEGRSTIAKEYPTPMNPLAADMLEKGGFLANFLSPGAPKIPTPAAPKPQGIKAYHGSPHDFDKFDISKIGTGEGAQAYGRGLYFAESEGVAKSYRDNLSADRAWKDKAIREAEPKLAQALVERGYPEDLAASVAQTVRLEHVMNTPEASLARLYGNRGPEFNRALADAWAVKNDVLGGPTGRMYEVRINADPEHFLNYDQIQQTPHVTAALAKLKEAGYPNPLHLAGSSGLEKRVLEVNKAAVEAGIPGIKYKDAMSRDGAGPGTSNYVVFDDKMIEILRKYGLLPPLAAGAAQAVTQGQDQQF